MLFTTLNFIIFFAIVFILYYLSKDIITQKYIILGASMFFYACANPYFIFVLLTVSYIAYSTALLIERYRKKAILFCSLTLLLAILTIFKYVPLLNQLYNLIFSQSAQFVSIIYPVGLSFYMFQAIGYVVGVYWGKYAPEKSFINFLLYTSFFPQIMQGPIAEYNKLSTQFKLYHSFEYENAVYGIQRIAWGFFEKLVVANNISHIITPVLTNSNAYGGMTTLFAMFLYSFQLYADFSGYTDIALGCAQMLGIRLDENFKSPYFSKSITEFWRRWHISLGDWFREFVFFPLLRSAVMSHIRRKIKQKNKNLAKNIPTVLSLLIFWFLVGLWHGASLSFILYGLYHGFFVIVEYFAEELRGGATQFATVLTL